MSVWYAILNALGLPMFEMDFMKNALLAVLLMAPLFGLLSTMIVTGRMSFFSDALAKCPPREDCSMVMAGLPRCRVSVHLRVLISLTIVTQGGGRPPTD